MGYFSVTLVFGFLIWVALWPVTLICIVLQVLLSKTEGKYNGMIVPGFMFVIPFLLTLFSYMVDVSPSALEIVLFIVATLVSSAIIPLAFYWLYKLLHDKYRSEKYTMRDEDRMKIRDL